MDQVSGGVSADAGNELTTGGDGGVYYKAIKKIIHVTASRTLTNNDHGAILMITGSGINLTWDPLNIRSDFNCELDCDTGSSLEIKGTDVEAPKGRILYAEKIGSIFRRPDNGTLKLRGEFVTA